MADIKVKKETILGEVEVSDTKKYVVSEVDSSIGKYINVQQHYKKADEDEDEWKKGKGQWLPYDEAEEIAKCILVAYE